MLSNLIVMKEYIFDGNRSKIPEAVDFIKKSLYERKASDKHVIKSMLAAEEILEQICKVLEAGSNITIEINSVLSNIWIRYTARGGEFTVADIQQRLLFSEESEPDEKTREAMDSLMERLFGDRLSIRCDKGKITVTQQVEKFSYLGLVEMLAALIMGIMAGLILQNYLPEQASAFLVQNVFSPVYNVMMNALKMLVAPLVFFSIASSIAEFSDIKALGRIAVKITGMYVLTSILAILTGLFTYRQFPIGSPALAAAVNADEVTETIEKGSQVTVSVIDTLVGIVPTDIVSPFQSSNMLQIIFIAVCLGLATATISKAAPVAKDFVKAMNQVFSKITEVVVSFMPLLVFCSMAKMMSTMNLSSFKDVIVWIPAVYCGDLIMVLVYMLLLLVFARLNPIKFLSKYYPAMISAFTLSSSNAALPSSIRQCRALGISERIYSFSLPLGATINMDGSCITLIISALFFARIYQLPMTGSMILQLFLAIILLSIGSPGVPGGNLVCLTLLIPQIGVPAEAISLVIGLYPIVSMMQTMANVTGDAVVTAIAAKSEGMMDVRIFNE